MKPTTIDFLLSALRAAEAAKRLFRNALSDRTLPQPRVINTDLAPIYGSAIVAIKKGRDAPMPVPDRADASSRRWSLSWDACDPASPIARAWVLDAAFLRQPH